MTNDLIPQDTSELLSDWCKRRPAKSVRPARRHVAPLFALLVILIVSPSALAQHAQVKYPDSIAVLGHSGATGYDSDLRRPKTDVNANSWATGTNPAVNSLYLRILAQNPKIKGHNVNLAQDGATVRELLQQAKTAVSLKQKAELLVIQIMDNDIVCPATKRDYAAFRAGLVSAFKVLTRGAPRSSVFVVSQFGSPTTQLTALTRYERLAVGGDGPCDVLNTSGRLVAKRLARLEATIHGYEAQLASACKLFSKCRYDNGAFGRIVDRHEYISEDLNHFSIRGHAKAAAVAWVALKRAGLVPR